MKDSYEIKNLIIKNKNERQFRSFTKIENIKYLNKKLSFLQNMDKEKNSKLQSFESDEVKIFVILTKIFFYF